MKRLLALLVSLAVVVAAVPASAAQSGGSGSFYTDNLVDPRFRRKKWDVVVSPSYSGSTEFPQSGKQPPYSTDTATQTTGFRFSHLGFEGENFSLSKGDTLYVIYQIIYRSLKGDELRNFKVSQNATPDLFTATAFSPDGVEIPVTLAVDELPSVNSYSQTIKFKVTFPQMADGLVVDQFHVSSGTFFGATWDSLGSVEVRLGCVSASLVGFSGNAAELEALEGITGQLIAQNQSAQAFYGDILMICRNIYTLLGDIDATQRLMLSSVYDILKQASAVADTTAAIKQAIDGINTTLSAFQTEAHTDSIVVQQKLDSLLQIMSEWWDEQQKMNDIIAGAGINGWDSPEAGAGGTLEIFGGGSGTQGNISAGLGGLDAAPQLGAIAGLSGMIFGPYIKVGLLFFLAFFLLHKAGE